MTFDTCVGALESHVDISLTTFGATRLTGLMLPNSSQESESLNLRATRALSLARYDGWKNLSTYSLSGYAEIEVLQRLTRESETEEALRSSLPHPLSKIYDIYSKGPQTTLDFWEARLTANKIPYQVQPTFIFRTGDDWGYAASRNPVNGESDCIGEVYPGSDWNFGTNYKTTPIQVGLCPEHQALLRESLLIEEDIRGYPVLTRFIISCGDLVILSVEKQPLGQIRAIVSSVEALGPKAWISIDPFVITRDLSGEVSIDDTCELDIVANDLSPIVPGCASGKAWFPDIDDPPIGPRIVIARTLDPSLSSSLSEIDAIVVENGDPGSHLAILCARDSIPLSSGLIYGSVREHLKASEWCTLDYKARRLLRGKHEVLEGKLPQPLAVKLEELQSTNRVRVHANADTAGSAKGAIELSAVGVGLVRTEHLFTSPELKTSIANTIRGIALTTEESNILIHHQASVLKDLFETLEGRPCTIRLLDAPVHEFCEDEEFSEQNPMLGFRGARLLIGRPQMLQLQLDAIASALHQVPGSNLKIMIPLVSSLSEFNYIRRKVQQHEACSAIPLGVMLETPRACLISGDLARSGAQFFSFGTNDLTQLTFGISRDDAASSTTREYIDRGIWNDNPFSVFDYPGIGKLIRIAVQDIKSFNHNISVSVCGEQAADTASAIRFAEMGIDSLSVSPKLVPQVVLALARWEAGRMS